MIRIETEQDVETLRQVARLLERENEHLHQKLAQLVREIVRLRGTPEQASQVELEIVQEITERVQESLSDGGAERRSKEDGSDVEGSEQRSSARRGHGPREQRRLASVEEVLELGESDRECGACGGRVEEMVGQFEVSEQITLIERQFVVVVKKRQKYRCRCNGSIRTAPAPAKLIPGGRYSVEFAVEVAASKYLDHLPLERQVRMMEREGLEIDSQTLWDQIDAAASQLEPLYEALWHKQLEQPVLHVDESRWARLDAKQRSNWSMLATASPVGAAYRILSSKSERSIRQALQGYRGILVADGYGVYEALARDGPDLRLANCWAHALRKYREIRDNFPAACDEVLELIGELYAVEEMVPGPFPGEEAAQGLRSELRQKRSAPVLEKIRRWAFAQGSLPRSALGQAVRYMLKRWAGLTLFLEHPQVPLDNNRVERALRGPVVGRKNHYGSKSKRGTEVAGLFYTLFETAKLNALDPKAYVRRALRAAIEEPGTVLLPQEVVSVRCDAEVDPSQQIAGSLSAP